MLRQVFTLSRLEMLPVVRRLPAYSRLAAALLRDPALRLRHKALVVGGVAYLLSPIDLIPGLVPVLGQLDDLAVALWALRLALRTMPEQSAARHLGAHGLSWDTLDADLARVGRTGRLLVRAGLQVGGRVAGTVGRAVARGIGTLLERRSRRLVA